jgi:acyl-CoA dehydrogenase
LRNNKKESILDWLLSQKKVAMSEKYPAFTKWKPVFFQAAKSWSETVDLAIAGGFLSDRVAYAFAAGYQSALQCLFPFIEVDTNAALCITEEGGGHPRAIKTILHKVSQASGGDSAWEMSGTKKFITNANEADRLFVAASMGEGPDGLNKIQMVNIKRNEPGITVVPMKDLPFIPEISHGILLLESVQVTEENLLPGDGYLEYIKPFRTIEDLHVSAAVLGYLFRLACQFDWPQDIKERLLCLLVSLIPLASMKPSDPAVHIVLGGVFSQMNQLVDSIEPYWQDVGTEIRNAWGRDKQLLNIAQEARARRLQTAWSYFDDDRA